LEKDYVLINDDLRSEDAVMCDLKPLVALMPLFHSFLYFSKDHMFYFDFMMWCVPLVMSLSNLFFNI